MAPLAILWNFFEKQWTENHLRYLSGLSRALFPDDSDILHYSLGWIFVIYTQSDLNSIRKETIKKDYIDWFIHAWTFRGTQREYSSKPPKHSIVERILVFKR